MLTTKFALGLVLAGLVAGCATNGSGGDDVVGDDDGEVPFTNGASTLAGTEEAGYVDGSRRDARFNNPVNVIYRDGKLYVADFDNSKLRVIDVESHITTTVINQQNFQRPFGLAFAADGTLYVSTDKNPQGGHDLMSGTIWRIDIAKKVATPIAADIGRPRGIAVLPDGRLVAVDRLHHVVEIIDPASGAVEIIAGTWDSQGMVDGVGAIARFASPYAIAVRSDGKLIVTDFENNRLRVVGMDGTTATFAGATAGFADGAMPNARFSRPQGLSMASNGDMYVTDLDNFRVRRIVGDTVQTVAGNGNGGHLDSDDPLAAELFGLEGLSVVPDGSMLFVADGNRGDGGPFNRVRQIKLK
jgi:DNA-binding beta-propeller fold protein YncE